MCLRTDLHTPGLSCICMLRVYAARGGGGGGLTATRDSRVVPPPLTSNSLP